MLKTLSIVLPSVLALSLFTLTPATQAAEYTLDKAHSTIGFKIRHMVSKTAGTFGDYDFKLNYDAAKPEASKVEAVIQTKSVNTANEKRDEHLRGADFFNVEKFPTMTFTSTSVSRVAPNQLKVEGNLTMLGVTKPSVLMVTEGGIVKDPWGMTRAGFTATTTVNRKDYAMVFNKVLDGGSLMLGEDVEVTLEIEATQAAPTAAAPAKKKK